jgi:hypothetical protein
MSLFPEFVPFVPPLPFLMLRRSAAERRPAAGVD